MAWKERTRSTLSRKQHFQFLLEPRSEIHRDQECEQCRVGKRVNRTPTQTGCTDARSVCQNITLHSLIIFHHANTRGSRLQAFVCFETFCHPRVRSRSLPQLTLTISTSSLSLSLTSPISQSSSPTHSSLLTHDSYIHTATIHGGGKFSMQHQKKLQHKLSTRREGDKISSKAPTMNLQMVWRLVKGFCLLNRNETCKTLTTLYGPT